MIASLLRPHTISSQLIDGLTDIVVGINDRNTNGVTTFISDTRRGDSRMLRLVWPRDIRALPEVVDTLCTRYSLSSLHRLFLKAPETATPIATLMRLMSHPSLQVLDLESPSCASILSNLLDSASYNGPEMWPAVALVTIRGTQPGNIGWFLERWSHARPSMRVDLSGAVVQCMDEADARAFIRRLGQALDSRYPWPHFRYWESKGTDMGKLRAILLGHTTAAAPLNGPRGPL
ncbi:hypothetical protein PsYK624_051140 [Phanerochaete sordida]|uniref:Uncharacterized protein n=1 Tax=Phanerochaete sordida TaxID=48140 RepID=A0A9P3G724_9APHY|nr:hypothetical protein PsYK624_051140 [Phanerochaete sordida]